MASIKPAQLGKTYIRILGRPLGRFIEFEFILNDEDLTVELVMPEHDFAEFCAYYDATLLPSEGGEGGEVIPMKDHSAGLYRPPSASQDS